MHIYAEICKLDMITMTYTESIKTMFAFQPHYQNADVLEDK